MSNVFRDQAKFMNACGQTVGKRNLDQFDLYLKLILGAPDARCAGGCELRPVRFPAAAARTAD